MRKQILVEQTGLYHYNIYLVIGPLAFHFGTAVVSMEEDSVRVTIPENCKEYVDDIGQMVLQAHAKLKEEE